MKNLAIVTLIIVAIAAAGYFFSQSNSPSTEVTNTMPTMDNSSASEMTATEEMDMSGLHIMPDGEVMLGDGTAVEEATINPDGTVSMPNGEIVTPAMDMRQ